MLVRHMLIAASLAAVAPAVSNAGAESAALKVCTAAFANSLAAKGAAAPAVKLNYHPVQTGSSLAEYYARNYTFYLKADDQKTGMPLARATCSATTGGTLLSLSATPLDTAIPALAAQF